MIEQLSIGSFPVPAREKNNIPVVMSSSIAYLPYTCVAMSSLVLHGSPDNFYDIFLLHQQDYTHDELILLERVVARKPNCLLRLVDVRGWMDDSLHAEGHVSAETYGRLVLPKLMRNYTNVLYLDSDLVVCRDVAELLVDTPADILLSGVVDLDVIGQYYGPEISMRYYLKKKLHIKEPDTYLQAGVLIFHIPAIRAMLGEDTLLQAGANCRLRYFDQDILNYLCNGHVQLLDLRWNVVTDCDGYRVRKIITHAPDHLYRSYLASRKDPWIVHFSGRQKPWNDPQTDSAFYFYTAVQRAGLEDLVLPRVTRTERRLLFKHIAAWLLPEQSRRRELCKIAYFKHKYRAVAWGSGKKNMAGEKNHAPFHTLEEFDLEMSGGVQYCTTIEPAFAGECAAVALVSSDEYAPFAAVVIASILANTSPKNRYDIVVLTNDMLLRNRWRIQQLADHCDNVSIRVLDISKMIEGFSFYTWAHFTSNTYYRLLTPDVFARYDKVVYLDSDIVVNHDIADLFKVDLKDSYLAAAYDTHVVSYCTQIPPLEQRAYNMKELGMKNPEQYFQAGVSLFNVTAIRRDFEEGYLIKQGLSHKLRWLDQDLINKLFYGKIFQLPNCWNVMVGNQPENLDEYYLPTCLRQEYYEARRAPYIVHYVGRAIPCYTTQPDLFEYFWKYARLTPFYEILIQRMAIDYAEKLAESVRIQMRQEFGKTSAVQRVKGILRSIADFFLPKGSRRRIYVKRFLFKFKKWN